MGERDFLKLSAWWNSTFNPADFWSECLLQNSLSPSPSRAGTCQVSRTFQKGQSRTWKRIPSHYHPFSLLPSPFPYGVGHMPLRIPGLMFILSALFGNPMMRTGSGGHHGITSCWLEKYFFNETMHKGTVRIYLANTLYLRDLLMLNTVPVQGSGLGAYYSWLTGLELCV